MKSSGNLSRTYLERYIVKNGSKAKNKLKYLEKKGYYKASSVAQDAKSQIRALNRKYGFNENWFYCGKGFRNKIKSNADLRVMYVAIKKLLSLNTRGLHREYNSLKEKYAENGVDFDNAFSTISLLSSDFHDIFSILTYNEVQTSLLEGDSKNMLDILANFEDILKDKDFSRMSDKQRRAVEKTRTQMKNKLSSKELYSIFKED